MAAPIKYVITAAAVETADYVRCAVSTSARGGRSNSKPDVSSRFIHVKGQKWMFDNFRSRFSDIT